MLYFLSLPVLGGPRAGLAQLVEQLFRKQQVSGSSPEVGSDPRRAGKHKPKWRNRQTRYVQGVVGESPWEFKSPLRHPVGQGVRDASARCCGRPLAKCAAAWHLNSEGSAGRMAADPSGSEESPSCAERGCPAKAGEALRRRQSRSARGQPRESNSDQDRRFAAGVKRAILPAAISGSAVTRWLAQAGSREQPRRRRRGRPREGSREMTVRNRTRLTPLPRPSLYGAYSSIGRAPVCGTGGCGIVPR